MNVQAAPEKTSRVRRAIHLLSLQRILRSSSPSLSIATSTINDQVVKPSKDTKYPDPSSQNTTLRQNLASENRESNHRASTILRVEVDREIGVADEENGTKSSQLCHFCQNLVNRWPQAPYSGDNLFEFSHHEDFDALRLSAQGGCKLCMQFHNSWPKFFPSGPMKKDSRVPNELRHYSKEIFGVEYFHLVIRNGSFKNSLRVVATPATVSQDMSNYDFTGLSESRLQQCKAWLENCMNKHPCCSISQDQRMPTRLLSVKGSKFANIRLCVVAELGALPRYATLSHCWGTRAFFMLKKDQLHEFRRNIPFGALSKTFQHAVQITRSLGLDYLWIDSMCIVQDDLDDWVRESALMSNVYGCSTINIAASSAIDGSGGCNLERDSPWKCQLQTTAGLFDCVANSGKFEESIDWAPLARRGWVMQERILSHRTLHFTEKEIFWECEESMLCETFSHKIPSNFKFSHWTREFVDNDVGWVKLVEMYSRCNLTQTKDKLVAISGLAQHAYAKTKDEYVAGLWKTNLLRQLCWITPTGSEPSNCTAPTWSWASTDGQIDFLWYEYSSSATFLPSVTGVSATRASDGHFEQVSAATLYLNCSSVVRAHTTDSPPENKEHVDAFRRASIKLATGHVMSIDTYFEAFPRSESGQALFLVPIQLKHTWPSIVGLILEPTKIEKGQYQRVGLFLVNSDNGDLAQLKDESNQVQDGDCKEVSLDISGAKRYHISLV